MKKKITLLALAFASLNLFAWEANVKAGYDFFRNHNTPGQFNVDDNNRDERGFKLGVEVLPYTTKKVDLGLGLEYNFGEKAVTYNTNNNASKKYFIPVYGLAHINLYQKEDNSSSFYLVGRLGGVAYKNDQHDVFKPGLYYGAGLGFDYKYFVAELLYDGAFVPTETVADQKTQNKVGFSLGLRFGDFAKKAMVNTETKLPAVEVVVEPTPEVVEKEVVAEPVVEEIVVQKVDTRSYHVFGYNVDAVAPSQKEINSIMSLVSEINMYNEGSVEVIGHADSTGSEKYNQKLSERRATSVANLLRKAGLKESISISTKGEGETKPIETNSTKEGRYKNRRVELNFINLK